jgi:predicted metalloprotease
VRYNPRARLNRGQVEVRGDGDGGGGMGFPGLGGGGGMRVGGGIGGLIIVVIIILLGGGNLLGGGASDTGNGATTGSQPNCQTGADANKSLVCALTADVNAVQAFWATELPRQTGVQYSNATAVLFTNGTQTGCGQAQSAMGPFYCPVDKRVYLDPTFFRSMLQGELHARGGLFAEAYVLAHEYGHHVQDLLGTMGRVRTQQGPTSDSVRLELQADCFAGIWAKNATTVKDSGGQPYILDLTQDDIDRAINAAKAVGDDTIQKETSGRVNPEQWTHGSSAERIRWFGVGFRQGTIKACDTFSAQSLG